MSIQIGEPPGPQQAGGGFALFALGFRPFFLVAGYSAFLLLGLWLLRWQGMLPAAGYFGLLDWHAHEMLFGYSTAVIAGFLLTAVRNWTGMAVPVGAHLAWLAGIWLLARIVLLVPGVPGWLVAVIDLSFVPLVAVALFRPLWYGSNRVNRAFLALFASMTVANLMLHLDALGIVPGLWQRGANLMLDTILIILLLVAGRVVPFFTEKAVMGSRPVQRVWVERAGFAGMISLALVELVLPHSGLAALLAILTAGVQALRLAGWHHRDVWRIPILWVLYTGYGWLILGLVLRGLAGFELLSYQIGLHALTAGAVGILTLGMMSRVALGHTGRELTTATLVNTAFVLLNLGAAIRVFFPVFWPQNYSAWINLAGLLWITAFLLFTLVYTPILTRSRIDGRPG